jgi:exonuclease III
MNNYSLIFIHNLNSWSPSNLLAQVISKIPNYNEIIPYVKKLFSPRYGSYFIIRVNKHKNDLKFFDVLDFLRDKIPETAKITWTLCNKLKQMNKSRKSNNIEVELNPMAKDFFSSHLNSNSSFFNLCVSWNINGWNTEKRDSILYLNSIFKPICICLQETGKSKYLPKDVSSPLIPYYNSVFLRANPKIPGMRGLFIGVHSSCSFFQEPFLYKYIISVNITSFWNQKCTIGNIYFPQSKWKEERLAAFDELSQWLRFHNRKNVPAVLVGDFNMSLKKIKTYISNNFPNWYIAPLYGNKFTYAKGTRSSCIDHVIYNEALAAHFNKTSVCTSFYGISDHKPIILSCNKVLSDGFIRPAKVSKWSTHICKTKNSDILSHNYFSILANDLDSHYNSLTADEMVEKFINTANNIGKDIKAFIPTNLKGSAFHCPYYIKKLSHEKHIAFRNIKPYFNCENVDNYLEQFNKYEKLCKLIKKTKSKFRSARFKANIVKIGNYFLNKDFKNGWRCLKKMAKPSYSSTSPTCIKSKFGQDIISPTKQLDRWAEYYKDLASDPSGHSLNRNFWIHALRNISLRSSTWNINDPITIDDI